MLPMGELTNPGQMRLALVQVVNWGTFHGAHTMRVDRNGTLLTGNSGVGKSTLFDAMLRVFDARPRSNEAAAQRAGGAVEDKRTTFTYMRGKVGDKAVGEGSASAFQRPGATWSAVALTFDNAAGTRVTVSALFDLPKNGTESSVGRYYLIDNKPLDLAAIEGIAEKRFTKSALDAIFPDAQIFDVHKAFAERFRRMLGINSDQALPLLRVIQAGKGLGGSVNNFFRDQVLDAPATLTAADDVVEEFSNLMSIRQRLEDVRQQRDQLAPVPGLNKDYAQSLLDANRLRELAGEEFEAYRQQLAVTVHEKTLARFKDLAQAKAKQLGAERGIRDGLAKDLRQLEADYNNQGGNAISAIEQSLENARVGLKLRQQVEESARKALSDAGLELEWTATGWEQAHEHAAARSAELKDDSEALKELRFEAFDGHATRKRELAAAQQELVSLKTRKSLLPPSSIENRIAISAATGVPEEQMPFGGELIDLAEGQEQWRPAAERALRGLATTLLVPGEHFAAVTRYLNDHSVRGALRAVDVSKPLAGGALAVEDSADGDLLAKLDILTMGPAAEAGEWIRERIALDYAYPCVEDPDELARLDKGLSLGGVVKRNRHTVEKDDRFTGRQDYVLGFDNASKLELVAAQVEDLQQELAKAAELAQSREESHQGMTRQLEALRRVAEDHRPWEQVSAAVAADELARIDQRLKDALAAQADLEPLRASIEAARHKHQSSTEAAAVLQSEYKAVDSQLSTADSLLDAARARLEQSPPSGATVAALEPYLAAFGGVSDITEMHELDNLANQVRTRLLAELHTAESRGQATSERLTRIFEGFVREWGTSISADHGTSIGAAGEFEARYHAIVSDGLPAQEAEFRQFFNQRTHESFSTLLHLLDEERRSITSRILPLNGILSEVNFHEGSFLELDIKPTLPATAKQFKDAIQNALKVRHTRPGKAAAPASGSPLSGSEPDDDAELTNRYKSLETLVKRLGSQTPEDRRWRAEVLDVRGHLFIQCKEHREVQGSGSKAAKGGGKRTEVFMHADTGSMSGGERQRFTAFIMAAALSYQLGIAEQGFTTYGTVMMDEAFVLASEEFAGAGIKALHEFGFQLLLAAPENVIDLSRHLGSVTEILRDKRTNRSGVLTAPVIGPRPGTEGTWRSEANPVDIVLR